MTDETTNPGEGEANKGGRPRAGRGKGTGTLERHGRTWRAVWTVDGRTYKRTTGTSSKTAAEKILREFVKPYYTKGEAKKDAAAAKVAELDGLNETAAALGERSEDKRRAAGRLLVPLAEAWGRFNDSTKRRSVSKNVNRIYEKRWGVFLAWMAKNRPVARALADVDAETADAFMREIRARSAPKTYNDYRALLSQVWRILDGDAGLGGFNPWREIAALDKETHERRELTREELRRIVAPLKGEMRVLFAIGIYTGLRLGDAVNLNWRAVDLEEGFISWTPHKTAKHGTTVDIPILPELAGILAATPRRGKRILPELWKEYEKHERRLGKAIQAIFAAAGIETQAETDRVNPKTKTARKAVEVGFHSLRHTFVSLAAESGIPLHIVQEIVGHTNPAMTRHYLHTSRASLRAEMQKFPARLLAPAAPALPAPVIEAEEVEAVPVDKARGAIDAFKRACEALPGAGLTKENWREVARILAAVEKKRRA